MNEQQAREEICRVGRSLFERGYVHATAGNISVRLDDGFLITPTDACLGFLDPGTLARVDLQGQQLAGAPASKTLVLHRRIYAAHAALGLVQRGVRQLVVAGGETSGAVVQALGIEQLRIGAQIDPGVPWCHAAALACDAQLHIALKSGNFGATDFFRKSFALLA